jgi:hypothetical protein
MASPTLEVGTPVNLTASSQLGGIGQGQRLIGFYVNSTSAGTIALTKTGSGGAAISGTITPAIGFHHFPADVPEGIYATIGGTLNVTFFLG